MKFKIIYVFLLTLVSLKFYSQATCATSLPFCASSNYNFPAGVNNGSAAAGPSYGCLLSQPNPAWYYVQISQTGPLVLNISGGAAGDVDFICWGPFPTATGNCGNLTAGNTIACGYSSSSTETCTINNAVAGQFYQILITNYSNQPQNINFNQSNSGAPGAGGTNCNFNSGVNSPSICPTKTATLVANSSLVNSTYLWMPGGATTQSITVNPALTTVYTVTITGNVIAGGATSTAVHQSTVTVLPTPVVNLSSNSMVCQGSNIALSATSGFSGYVWTTTSGTYSTTANTYNIPNATTAMAGTYSVSVTSAQGCMGSNTTTVGIIPTNPVTAPVPASACEGGVINLTANATGAIVYSWVGPGGFTSTQQNPTLNNVTVGQSGTYTVTAIFTAAGTTNTCATVATTTVSIIPASTVTLSPLGIICNNAAINLTAPNGGTTYSWTGPNAFVSNLQNPVIADASIVNKGVYSVAIAASGCIRTGSINVDVYNILSYTSVSADTTLCEGSTGRLNVVGSGGSGAYNYLWNPPTDLSSANSSNPVVTGNTTTTYTVTLSDSNCPATQVVNAAITISVNPLPVITIGANMSGCEPYAAALESISNPPSANCSWSFGDGLTYNQCNTTTGFVFPTHGTYNATLTVTDINNCQNTAVQNAYVTVFPKPNVDFSYTPNVPTVLINELSFSDNSSIGSPMQSWHWNFGDYFVTEANDTSAFQNPSHVYDNAGTYTVSLSVVNSFGCENMNSKIITVEEEFALFIPNAFSPMRSEGKNDIFIPQGIGFLSETFTMAIYDRWGTVIYKTNDITKGWDGSIKGGKPVQGVYVYKISVQDFKKREKQFVGHVTVL